MGQQDGGLLDIAIHPDYAANGWVYLAYSEPGPAPTSTTKIVRGRIRDGRWEDQQTIYQSPAALYVADNTHFGARFLFDAAGHLFFTIGDRGTMADAQSLGGPNGKIHRVFDDGRVPPDNPFVDERTSQTGCRVARARRRRRDGSPLGLPSDWASAIVPRSPMVKNRCPAVSKRKRAPKCVLSAT